MGLKLDDSARSDRLRARANAAYDASIAFAHTLRILRKDPQAGYLAGPIIATLIYLADGLKLSDQLGDRLAERGDDIQVLGAEGDLTSLIVHCRNAACHSTSENNIVGFYRARNRFNVFVGRSSQYIMDDIILENPHADDVAIFVGSYRLFIRRNIQKAIQFLTARCNEQDRERIARETTAIMD